MHEITSVHNDRVKQWSQLLEKKYRDKQRRFLIEGVHLVQEALRAPHIRVITVAVSIERGIPFELAPFYDAVGSENGTEWVRVSDAVLAKCSDTETPQGVFAVVDKMNWNLDTILRAERSMVVVVDGVQDPGNLGTIIRSADAVAADGVLLGKGTVDLYNPKVVRSTMGSLFHLPIIECDLGEVLPHAKEQGIRLLGTSLDAQHNVYETDLRESVWFVVGNEGKGVSPNVQRLVETNVLIPMPGQAESLNVAMATTVVLFEALRQRNFGNR